jgi:hypothetical protein
LNELEALREEARKAHRAAGKKASRLRTGSGVEIGGSKYDVRRDPAKIKRYNKRQLSNYIGELKGFTDRKTQFVGLQNGVPAPRAKWEQAVKLTQKNNKLGMKNFDRVADIFLPNGNTVKERSKDLTTKSKRADGAVANRPYAMQDVKKPSQYPSEEALDIAIKSLSKRTSGEYHPEQIVKGRENAFRMLEKIGDKEMAYRVYALNDAQFDYLWNFSGFPTELLPAYLKSEVEAQRMKQDDLIEAMNADGKRDEAIKLLESAEELKVSKRGRTIRQPIKEG